MAKKKKNLKTVLNEAVAVDSSQLLNDTTPSSTRLTGLDFEKQAAYDAAGIEAPVYGVIGKLYKWWTAHGPVKTDHQVSKALYLWLLVLTGWMGGHRYYEKRYKLGLLYTLFCWTGIPLTMCVIDAMIAIPIKKDDKGLIWI